MKFISPASVISKGRETFYRFPLPVIFAVASSVIGIYLVDLSNKQLENSQILFKIIMTCALGALAFISLQLFIEKENIKGRKNDLLSLTLLLLIATYYLSLPDKLSTLDVIRFFLLFLGMHLVLAFLPFSGKNQINGFWHFNKSLFVHFLQSAVFSAVIYAGISIAIVAVDKLFSANIGYKIYGKLWIAVAGIFNTWYFLSGIPNNFKELNSESDYPTVLKVFTKFILVPIITVYVIILYAYGLKIIVQWKLPEGWVAYLTLGFSVAGIFTLLLLFPLKSKADSKWALIYEKAYYLALIPLIALLFIAITIRINEYGITENRYFVFFLAVWLTFIAIYMSISKVKNIKIIPASLALITFLSSFGPWSAFNISRLSQLEIIKNIATKNNLLVNGKVIKSEKTLNFEDRKSFCSATEYICDIHGYNALQELFSQNLDSIFKDSLIYNKAGEIAKLAGIEYIDRWYRDYDQKENFYINSTRTYNDSIVNIKGFDYMFELNLNTSLVNEKSDSVFTKKYSTEKNAITVNYSTKNGVLQFAVNDTISVDTCLSLFVEKTNLKKTDYDNVSDKEMEIILSKNNFKIKLELFSISGYFTDNRKKTQITSIIGRVYFTYDNKQF